MFPYLLLMGAPSVPAMAAIRRSSILVLLIGAFYVVMIGLRFKVGVDWNNYIGIYSVKSARPLTTLLFQTEPGFTILLGVARRVGGGIILVNVVAALVFCWGLFSFCSRCREPFIAIVVATPILVVGMAMSGIRQGMAIGIISYLFSVWDERTLVRKTILILIACLFHFSAVFNIVFVVLAAPLSAVWRTIGVVASVVFLFGVIAFAPSRVDFYADAYVSAGAFTASGAGFRIVLLALPALVYFAVRRRWVQFNGRDSLIDWLAIASMLAFPAIIVSSVGADRFSLYFWPMAMYVWSGLPALIANPFGRNLYRLLVISGCFALMIAWMGLGNHNQAWLPYRNYLWAPSESGLVRHSQRSTLR